MNGRSCGQNPVLIFFDEQLTIYVKAESVGNSSADIHYMGKREDCSIGFVSRVTIVQISKKTGKGFPWTEQQKKLLINNEKISI
ncbi:hypothetical protein V7161_08545 [Neobacillus drentensis]|uniref:hypothetical protein n=1 Tax=Neobacillus drentensis TaxID=220684 RepID=UPI003000DDE1